MINYSRKIRLGENTFLVIDLTCPLFLGQEGYPGDFTPARSCISDISRDGWHYYIHELGDHCFHPHCDAPNHFQADRQDEGMEIYGLDWSFHSACLIDLSSDVEAMEKNGITFLRTVKKEHLEPFSGDLSKREAILIRTGYDRWVEENLPHDPGLLPYLDREAAGYIASFTNIRVVGIDSLTVDAYGLRVSHLALRNVMIVESLVHLSGIPGECRSSFDLQTSPIRITGATGGPVIAYAYIPVNEISGLINFRETDKKNILS
jgi:kynurenine formamidase